MTGVAVAQKRILVVDDESRICRLLQEYLECYGYEVLTETSGQQALIRATEQPPHLVILDLRLPDLHGYQVCQELRKQFHSWTMPILMLTAMDRPVDQLRGFEFGADGYMHKPFALEELRKTVASLIGGVEPTHA